MSGTTITILIGTLTVCAALIMAYFAAKANQRDQREERRLAITEAVDLATQPIKDRLADALAANGRLSAELEQAKTRITQLEDWLYSGRRGERDKG